MKKSNPDEWIINDIPFFFNQFFFCYLPKDGYLTVHWCKVCVSFEKFYFYTREVVNVAKNILGVTLFVHCRGCDRDLVNEFTRLGKHRINKMESDGLFKL